MRESLMVLESRPLCFIVFVTIIDLLQTLYMDVGKLPKIMCSVSSYLAQLLLYFIIQTVSNRLRLIMLKSLMRFHYCPKKNPTITIQQFPEII